MQADARGPDFALDRGLEHGRNAISRLTHCQQILLSFV
jgi:hypothetical protein